MNGWPLIPATSRFLKLAGQEPDEAELVDALGPSPTAESVLEELRARGLEVRCARVKTGELSGVTPPALLELANGKGWLMVSSRARQRLLAGGPDGDVVKHTRELVDLISGTVIETVPTTSESGSVWRRVAGLILDHPGVLVQLLSCALLAQLLTLAVPQATRLVLDRALPEGGRSLLVLAGAGLFACAVFQASLGWVRGRALLFLQARLDVGAGRSYLEHVFRLPFSFVQKESLGSLTLGFHGLARVQSILLEQVASIVIDSASGVASLVYLVSFIPGLSGVVLVSSLAVGVIGASLGIMQFRLRKLELDARGTELSLLAELISGITTIKIAGAEQLAGNRWLSHVRRELHAGLLRQRLGLLSDTAIQAIRQAVMVVLLVLGARKALAGEITPGALIAGVQLSTSFMGSVLSVVNSVLAIGLSSPEVNRTRRILEEPALPRPPRRRGVRRVEIVLDDVWYRYNDEGPWIVKSESFRVEPGTHHRILGPSGFGKTTRLRLIGGVLRPTQGHVRIGGLDAEFAGREILYLPQFIQLYGTTLWENLEIFSGHAPRNRIMEAARLTGLEDWVASLGLGYRTPIPFGGGSLSGGQRQLLALTAMVASDRTVLVLDEPMANLDIASQGRLMAASLFAGRTVIYAAHTETIF